MNKDQLQQEILKRVKPGMKPSDLKKQNNTPASSPPPSPIIEPIDKQTKQKPSQENISPPPIVQEQATIRPKSPVKNQDKALIKQLQNQVNFHANLANNYLTNLQATMAQLDQAELTIQDLQAKIKTEEQKYSELEKANKSTANEPVENLKTFLCSDCKQTKPSQELSRQFSHFSFCLTCSKKARQQAQQEKTKPEPQEFICQACQQTKQEIPNKMKLDKTLQAYPICSACRPNLKEFNEADLITDELWLKYPYSSASEILEKEFNIQKEETW